VQFAQPVLRPSSQKTRILFLFHETSFSLTQDIYDHYGSNQRLQLFDMRTSIQIAALTFALAAPVLTQGTLSTESGSTAPLGTAAGGALDPMVTHPPIHNNAKLVVGAGLTIQVTNSFGAGLSISYESNAGAPTPVGNPQPSTLGVSTQAVFPTGWAGRINIGKTLDSRGSKIEASYTTEPDVDISYVDGYTIPITCSCGGQVVTGCNIPLFHDGQSCPDEGPGPICINPQVSVPDGPATPFFAPCAGAVYTYPNDNLANSYGQCNDRVISCCVGSTCPRNPRQPAKRDLSPVGSPFGLHARS
jgi:hypothetical protein